MAAATTKRSADAATGSGGQCRVNLIGPLRVSAPDGTPVAIQGPRTRAMVADGDPLFDTLAQQAVPLLEAVTRDAPGSALAAQPPAFLIEGYVIAALKLAPG